jgi:hypothetical protein
MMTVTIAVAAYGDAQTSLDLLVGADPHDVRWTVEGQRFALTVQ